MKLLRNVCWNSIRKTARQYENIISICLNNEKIVGFHHIRRTSSTADIDPETIKRQKYDSQRSKRMIDKKQVLMYAVHYCSTIVVKYIIFSSKI